MYSHLDISHINQIRYNYIYIYVIHINDDTHTSNNHDYSVHDEIFLKQYIHTIFKIFNALDCVARFHPGLGDFSPLITSIK